MGSDLKRAFTEDGQRRTHIGGQALIEGVMMRGKLNWAVAVREPDGHMHSEEHPLSKKGKRAKWLSWPLVRGCVALVDSLVLGYKALEIAANHAFDDEDEQAETVAEEVAAGGLCIDGDFDGQEYDSEGQGLIGNGGPQESDGSRARRCEPEQDPPFSWKHDFGRPDTMIDALGAQRTLEVVTEPNEQSPYGGQEGPLHASEGQGVPAHAAKEEEEPFFGKAEMAISLVMGLVLGVGLFIFLPALASNVLVGEYETNPLAWNIIDGLMRVVIFVFYVWLIGRMKDIKRMFSYHGAEHKTIHCYEHGLELTPENARSFPRLHVHDHRHFGVHHHSPQFAHRGVGDQRACRIRPAYRGAHCAYAFNCWNFIRNYREVGGQPSRKSLGAYRLVAGYADAAPNHQRAR